MKLGIPLDPSNPLKTLLDRSEQATKKSSSAIADILERIPKDIDAEEFVNYEPLVADLAALEAELSTEGVKKIGGQIQKEIDNLVEILSNPERGAAPDLLELEEVKRRYQRSADRAYKAMAQGDNNPTQFKAAKIKEVFARNLRRFVLDNIPDEATRESMRELNRMSSKQIPIQRILGRSIDRALVGKSVNPAPVGTGPLYQISKMGEVFGASPKGRLSRANIRESFDALPPLLKESISATPFRLPLVESTRVSESPEGMASLETLYSAIDPLSKIKKEPVKEPQSIGPMVLDTKLPRSTEYLISKPNLVKAKVLQSAGEEVALQVTEALKEADRGNPRIMQTLMPQLAQMYPEMFEYDEYNAFDGKIIDPAAQSLYRESLSQREDMDELQKTQAIQKFNKTYEVMK
jgi:hypothetical protein